MLLFGQPGSNGSILLLSQMQVEQVSLIQVEQVSFSDKSDLRFIVLPVYFFGTWSQRTLRGVSDGRLLAAAHVHDPSGFASRSHGALRCYIIKFNLSEIRQHHRLLRGIQYGSNTSLCLIIDSNQISTARIKAFLQGQHLGFAWCVCH